MWVLCCSQKKMKRQQPIKRRTYSEAEAVSFLRLTWAYCETRFTIDGNLLGSQTLYFFDTINIGVETEGNAKHKSVNNCIFASKPPPAGLNNLAK